ncbi:MgtC/SapB family protein [Skermanella pratensis]|uniref:MgtC/SapB family protein n=1 Tax=Skermanella pratensis TaxID=2233999 RepID=UPI0013019365|nr:MgtC/SapB family protein [Skermanella pratensis]
MDFAEDFRTITPLSEMAFRLVMASFCGMVLGIDREIRGKSAGLRTHMLVALSSAGTTLVTLEIFEMLKAAGHSDMDPLRIVQGLAQAIGFISAGVIIQARRDVHGLTTAVNIWLCSAIGVGAGAGLHALALMVTLFAAVILTGLHFVEKWVFHRNRPDKGD